MNSPASLLFSSGFPHSQKARIFFYPAGSMPK